MEVEVLNLDLPLDLTSGTLKIDDNRQVATLIEHLKLR